MYQLPSWRVRLESSGCVVLPHRQVGRYERTLQQLGRQGLNSKGKASVLPVGKQAPFLLSLSFNFSYPFKLERHKRKSHADYAIMIMTNHIRKKVQRMIDYRTSSQSQKLHKIRQKLRCWKAFFPQHHT